MNLCSYKHETHVGARIYRAQVPAAQIVYQGIITP